MSILGDLAQKRNFTEAEAAIADFILQNPEEIATLGIAELARRTYSSNAAIIRMCRKLNITGYKEFRIAFASELEKHRFETYAGDVNYPFALRDGPNTIMKNVAELSKDAIESCYAASPPQLLGNAARRIAEADHVYIYAIGDSYISALMFANMLIKIGIHSVMVNQFNEGLTVTYSASERDVALFVTYSGGVLSALRRDLRALHKNRCKTILISSLKEVEGFDQLISIPDKEAHFGKTVGYYSQVCIRYVLNCLYGMIYSLNMDKNREHKDQADRLANQE